MRTSKIFQVDEVSLFPLGYINIPFERARRTVSGTQHFITGTRGWTNRLKKLESVSLTSLTCKFIVFILYFLISKQ